MNIGFSTILNLERQLFSSPTNITKFAPQNGETKLNKILVSWIFHIQDSLTIARKQI